MNTSRRKTYRNTDDDWIPPSRMIWTEDWDEDQKRPPNERELLRESCRRLRHIRAAAWTIAGIMIAGLFMGLIGLIAVLSAPRHYW
jgi:hypothetical protein